MTEQDLSSIAQAAKEAGESVTDTVLGRLGEASSPAMLFDALDHGDGNDALTVIGRPGQPLEADPAAGDVLLSRVRGERDSGRLGVVTGGELIDWSEAQARGRPVRDPGPGLYAEVLADATADGGVVAARVTDASRRLGMDRMLIRPDSTSGERAPEPELAVWQGERWPGLAGVPELAFMPEGGPIAAGRLTVDEVPLLGAHHGRHPDLVLRWNAMPDGVSTVDVVVHFHGYSGHGAAMRLDLDKEPRSGLDFANPDDPADPRPGRRRPTLGILPRGNYFGGRSGAGYDHPALATATGLRDLIAVALERFVDTTRAIVAVDRLILTAHSGGGAGLTRALRHNNPHEVHVFDALYGATDALVDWAQARLHTELGGGAPGALRVLYIPATATAGHSLEVGFALRAALGAGASPEVASRYCVEETTVGHNDIPRRFGWRLLADAGAQLAAGQQPSGRGRAHHGGAAPDEVPVADEAQLQAQWDAHPRAHRWFRGGLSLYVELAPLYARHGIADAAAYLDQNIVSAEFFGHRLDTHRDMAAALQRAEANLRAAGLVPEIRDIDSLVPRPIRSRAGLSQHALGLAVDINTHTNQMLRATDNGDVVQVIAAVTGVDLGTTQTAATLRQASAAFRATYGDEWLRAREQELQAAEQSGDTARASSLRALVSAVRRYHVDLRELARTGFFDLDQRLVDALVAAGLTWGGSWSRSKDFMHFEFTARSGTHSGPAGQAPPNPAPSEPAPGTPGPSEPAPRTSGPSEPAPRTSGPSEPAPGTPGPSVPAPGRPDLPLTPPVGGWPMAAPPGAGVTLTPQQERRIAHAYAHVLVFYRRYADLALADQRSSGVPAVFTLAQGGIESGWGRSMPGNMLFGVKADEHHVLPGERQLLWTHEIVTDPHHYDRYEHDPPEPLHDPSTGQQRADAQGRLLYRIRVKLWFRRFAAEADAIANHSAFLQRNRLYAEAFQHTDDPEAFAWIVARAGYATSQAADHGYERALLSAIDLVNRVAAYAAAHPDDNGVRAPEQEAVGLDSLAVG